MPSYKTYMKILVFSQQYWPETWRITDMCEELVKRGHSVTVICGLPNYDTGKIRHDYLHHKNRFEDHNGVYIVRCNEHPRKRNFFDLFLNYHSYAKSAAKMARYLSNSFDIVLLNGLSPVIQSIPGLRYAKANNKRVCMYCLDLWPESLSVGGVKKRGFTSIVYKHYLQISKNIYSSLDHIFVTSPGYIPYLSQTCGINSEKISYLPQYSDLVDNINAECLFFDKSKKNFTFAGNIGKAQDVETIIKAASLLDNNPSIVFHIFGSGSALNKCQSLVKKTKTRNIIFHGRVPSYQMPSIFASSLAMLVTLSDDDFTSLVLPGKLQSYLGAAKPIISACNGATNDVITDAKCGYSVASGDYRGLAASVLKMSTASAQQVSQFSQNAFAYSSAHFNRQHFFDILESKLLSLSKQ